MSAAKTPRVRRAGVGEARDACRVVVIYEDVKARLKAADVCRKLDERIGGSPVFDCRWWQFDRLVNPAFARRAGAAVAEADVLLFSLSSLNLPKEITRWLDRWTTRRVKSDGLLALMPPLADRPLSGVNAPVKALEKVARRHGMDFLCPTLLPGGVQRQRFTGGTPTIPVTGRRPRAATSPAPVARSIP